MVFKKDNPQKVLKTCLTLMDWSIRSINVIKVGVGRKQTHRLIFEVCFPHFSLSSLNYF